MSAAERSGGCSSPHLTRREVEVLLLIARGFTSKIVAMEMGISRRTVEDHLRAMRGRAGAQNSSELITRGFAAGIIVPSWPPQWSGTSCLGLDDGCGTAHLLS